MDWDCGRDPEKVVAEVAAEVRRLIARYCERPEGECLRHAKIGQQLFSEKGIDTRLVIGEAAWRLGNDSGDVIAHTRKCRTVAPFGSDMFHAWLEQDECIIDFTTYTLPVKARLMDAADGMRTNVLWCPEYLYVPKLTISSYPDVRDKHAGLYHYHRNSAMEHNILSRSRHLDEFAETASLLRSMNPSTNLWVINEHGDLVTY